MRRGSVIDDVKIDSKEASGGKGYPIIFENTAIRNMLKLGKANKEDVFFDLGSGWGQTAMIALTEFGVKKAVGIERITKRWEKACQRRDKWLKQRPDISPDRWQILRGNISTLSEGNRLKGESLKDATLIYYGIETIPILLKDIRRAWAGTKGRKLLYYNKYLFPEIMPTGRDFPFFVSEFPFTRPRTEEEWLTMICGKHKSSLVMMEPASNRELWDELSHDYEVVGLVDQIRGYKRRLRNSIERRRTSESSIF